MRLTAYCMHVALNQHIMYMPIYVCEWHSMHAHIHRYACRTHKCICLYQLLMLTMTITMTVTSLATYKSYMAGYLHVLLQ